MDEIEQRYASLKAKAFAAAPEISVAELLQLQQASNSAVVLCDVRSPEECATSTLPGAQSRAAVDADLDALRQRKATVVCVCTIGARSGVATLALRAKGIEAVNLKGGILAWTHAQGQLVEPATGASTRRVHVYSADWALQADGFEPVSFARPPAGATLLGVLRDKAAALFGRG